MSGDRCVRKGSSSPRSVAYGISKRFTALIVIIVSAYTTAEIVYAATRQSVRVDPWERTCRFFHLHAFGRTSIVSRACSCSGQATEILLGYYC